MKAKLYEIRNNGEKRVMAGGQPFSDKDAAHLFFLQHRERNSGASVYGDKTPTSEMFVLENC